MALAIDDAMSSLYDTKTLLFFLGETLDGIQQAAIDYRDLKEHSDKSLAYSADRSIDKLLNMQEIILEKMLDIEKSLTIEEG